MSTGTTSRFERLATEVQVRRAKLRPRFLEARRDMEDYLRFWELAEIDNRLTPHTFGPPGTETRFLTRSPFQLAGADDHGLEREIEIRFVRPLAGLFPLMDDWTWRFLEGNSASIEPAPMGCCYTWEDLNLDDTDPKYFDCSLAIYWLFNAGGVIDTDELRSGWAQILEACGFPAEPFPAQTLGLDPDLPYPRLDLEAFRSGLEAGRHV